jgi:hypothetical protein
MKLRKVIKFPVRHVHLYAYFCATEYYFDELRLERAKSSHLCKYEKIYV